MSGERLYLADSGDAKIASYAIGAADGRLTGARDEITSGFTILGNLVASNGRIYVADTAIGVNPSTSEFETNYLVKSYEIGTNGTLSIGSAQESEIDFAFQALAISGDRMFVAADRQIASYEINSGALSNPRIISILDNPSALLAADGRLYVADADADKIVSYEIEASGGLSDLRDEVVENLDEPAAIEATGGRIYIADRGVVDKIISYDVGRRFEPFVYPRFLHGEESGQPVQGVSFIRVNDEGDPVMTVSAETNNNGVFDPLQDGVYDENEIQINQVLFGLGTIRASVGAPEGYQFDRSEPYVGFQIGVESKPLAGWSGKDVWVGRKDYRLEALGTTTIEPDDLARFNIASDGNGRKVASIAPVRVPNLPFENLPKLIYGGGDKDAPVGGAHYLRVGDSQMTVSRHTNPNGSFDPIGKSGESPAGIAGTVLFATESIAVDSEGKYVVQAGTFIGAATLSGYNGNRFSVVILWEDQSYVFVDSANEDLNLIGDLPGDLFAGGQTPPRIDYLAFEFFVEAEDKYPRFYHDGDYDGASLPLAGAHYLHSGLTVSRVTDENGVFNPIYKGKEVGVVYFATESIAVDTDGVVSVTNFADGSFIGAYTTALSFDGDLTSSGFRERDIRIRRLCKRATMSPRRASMCWRSICSFASATACPRCGQSIRLFPLCIICAWAIRKCPFRVGSNRAACLILCSSGLKRKRARCYSRCRRFRSMSTIPTDTRRRSTAFWAAWSRPIRPAGGAISGSIF